jgi:hypothetical protein
MKLQQIEMDVVDISIIGKQETNRVKLQSWDLFLDFS